MTCPLFLIFVLGSLPSLSLSLLSSFLLFSFFFPFSLLSCHFLSFFFSSLFLPPSLFLSLALPSFQYWYLIIWYLLCHYATMFYNPQNLTALNSVPQYLQTEKTQLGDSGVPRWNADCDVRLVVLYIYDIISLKVREKALI